MTAPFDQMVRTINGDQTPRVWSLLVTVFGDLAQDPDARISGQTLGRLAALIGLKPEAVRVALHRLRKDGWIDSHRTGRTSAYLLTPFGSAQSARASPLIYATAPGSPDAWLALSDPGLAPADDAIAGVWITPQIRIVQEKPPGGDVFCTRIDPATGVPDWMAHRICDPDLAEQSQHLQQRLTELGRLLAHRPLTPLQTAALRVLIVHSWRRIVLKAPDLPDHVFPGNWAGSACRSLVADLLELLPEQTLDALDDTKARRAG